MYHPDFGLPVSYSVEVVGDDPEEQVARTGEGGGGEKRNNCSRKTALDGEFLLGQTNSGQSFGLTREEVNRHVFISGQSGVGKSTLIDNLFRRGHELGVHCVHFDRKGDLEHLARDGVESYSWRQPYLSWFLGHIREQKVEEGVDFVLSQRLAWDAWQLAAEDPAFFARWGHRDLQLSVVTPWGRAGRLRYGWISAHRSSQFTWLCGDKMASSERTRVIAHSSDDNKARDRL